MTQYRIQPLDAQHRAAEFHCGQSALDQYIQRYAAQDVRRNLSRSFVASPAEDQHKVAGYYTLSAGSVNCSEMPVVLARKLPRYPVPVALLGRLAVDTGFQRQGLGVSLLADACIKVAQASATLAVAGIIVDAKDQTAARFYQSFGFQPLPGKPERLLLPAAAFIAARGKQ